MPSWADGIAERRETGDTLPARSDGLLGHTYGVLAPAVPRLSPASPLTVRVAYRASTRRHRRETVPCLRSPVSGSRCPEHALAPRGYAHRRARAAVLSVATRCAVCGEAPTRDNPLTLGHLKARANGGGLEPSNLQAECRRCNLSQGATDRRPRFNLSATFPPRQSRTSASESFAPVIL